MDYQNPVVPGFHPDPSICRAGEDYYLVTSSFEYVPGVPLFHSRDLVHWRLIGHCLTRPSQLKLAGVPSSGGIYAPTIRFHAGRFYMVTTNVSDRGNFYVWTDDPAGEWSEPVWVDQGGIDPSLCFDDDGRVYFTSQGDDGCYQSEIDAATGRRLTEPRRIWSGTGGAYPEAPHLYKIGDWYYLMMAEGGTEYGHMETIARSRIPYGPFESCPRNPILSHRSFRSPIQATGHADLVQAHDGSWWLVCLGIRPQTYPPKHHLGRETFLAPVTWDADGWPVVGDNGHLALTMEAAVLPPVPWPEPATRDDFAGPQLGLDWNLLRDPAGFDWSLTARPGFLRLHGSALTLDQVGAPAFVGRRQEHFDCRAATLLEFQPEQDGEEAGLTVRMNERFHYEIAVSRVGGQRCVIFRRTIAGMAKVEYTAPLADGPVVLAVAATPLQYRFSFAVAGATPVPFGSAECAYLSTEVAGGFTGVYFGLYASGTGKRSTVPADFDWFDYEPQR